MNKNEDKKRPFAKKSLGQNFLVDQNYILKIVSALNPEPQQTIIEIGPGRGALTEKLVQSRARVIAIELDKDLIPILQNEFRRYENFQLFAEDALNVNFNELIGDIEKKAKLVANLPYYISTAILQRLIEQRENFSELVLMLQKEVVERITAEAGNRERGFLTVLVEAFFESEKLFDVPPNAFRPVPKVWSSVIRLKTRESNDFKTENELLFREIVSCGFRLKRKTILNNLKNYPHSRKLSGSDIEQILKQNRIDPQRRAESLTVSEWKSLAAYFAEKL